MKRYVLYYRVSTKNGAKSRLDLEAQQAAAHRFVGFNGGEIIAEYTEVEAETNKRNRPALREAAGHTRSAGACLVIAKLDRLVRNVPFISALKESGVEFVCCDNQHANQFTLHILAAVAQQHSQKISERTKAAMAEAKAKGIPLGSHRPGHWEGREHRNGWKKAVKAASAHRTAQAQEVYAFVMPRIKEMREAGRTLDEIAAALNADGHRTTAGTPFTHTSVWRLIKRYLGDEFLRDNPRGTAAKRAESGEATHGP
jgi:DNA invertase Pin-like site-specific DNA recombinase